MKTVLIASLTFLLLNLAGVDVFADNTSLIKPEIWGADKTISTHTPDYAAIEQIHIVEIPLSKGYTFENETLLVRTIYYHYVFRLGYPEPIFNILIAPSGQAYELTINGLDSQVSHDKAKGIIVIGIVTTDTTSVDKNLQQINDQVLSVATSFGLSEKDIFASKFKLNYSKPPTVSFLPSNDQEMIHLVETIKNNIQGRINPFIPKIEVSPNSFSLEVEPAQLVEVSIAITNNSDIPIYGGKLQSVYVGAIGPKDKTPSCFDPHSWITPRWTGELSPARIAKGESGTIKFKCKAEVMPGEYQEKLQLVTGKGQWIDNTTITLNVKVKDTGQKVLQIRETGIGYLNVRQEPSASSAIISTVGVGEQFLFEEYQNGFYKIKIDDKYGWVSSRYVDILKN